MKRIDVHEVVAHASRYLKRVEKGEHIVICRNGEPIAELLPLLAQSDSERPIGSFEGQFEIDPEGFEPPSPDELDLPDGK